MHNIRIHLDFTFPLVLTVIFIILKGLNIVDWTWIWIISPLWIFGIFILILLMIYGIIKLREWWWLR